MPQAFCILQVICTISLNNIFVTLITVTFKVIVSNLVKQVIFLNNFLTIVSRVLTVHVRIWFQASNDLMSSTAVPKKNMQLKTLTNICENKSTSKCQFYCIYRL